MRLVAIGLGLMACAIVAACGEDTEIGTTDAGLEVACAEVEVGTGASSYVPVEEGDTVYLYRGPQGGYMIHLGVRARGIDPTDAEVCYTQTFTTGYETGTVFGEGCWRVKLPNDLGDGWHERVGIWGEVSDAYWMSTHRIKGQDARIDVTISDRAGCTVTSGWTVHIHEQLGL